MRRLLGADSLSLGQSVLARPAAALRRHDEPVSTGRRQMTTADIS